ncbi:hypothetical protein EYZ11_009542 [Aspergillus tanneri]|uniref:Uncharacterized protein n=1 Tax=Aspergillus tanneri TaxID=1220188 RepID=A0A4S3J7N1_9EURO|nr:hypothetical protein EYZ11_009542 [Aspergillus tanneri]
MVLVEPVFLALSLEESPLQGQESEGLRHLHRPTHHILLLLPDVSRLFEGISRAVVAAKNPMDGRIKQLKYEALVDTVRPLKCIAVE